MFVVVDVVVAAGGIIDLICLINNQQTTINNQQLTISNQRRSYDNK